jgi:hypothetical protein
MNATYSPDDNKLRLYSSSRLDPELYARVRAAGFIWAAKQGLFVAPAWTPQRDDLLTELCGEIGDEDTSLGERAEDRAERFEQYREHRAEDAEHAHAAVSRIADNIPLGQPILVGHHSERHARKDAERIEDGMRRALKMWETSKYWESRAAGAIRHAKYKERPDVRARRIKGLEADVRRQERTKADAERTIRLWTKLHEPDSLNKKDGTPSTFLERAVYISGHTNGSPFRVYSELLDGKMTPEEAQRLTLEAARGQIAWADRWLQHLANRLTYERAMLADAGGTVADRTGPEVGGAVRCWAAPRGGYAYIQKVNKVSVTILDNWDNGGRNFTRTIPFDKLAKIMTAAEVQEARGSGRLIETESKVGFLLSAPPEPKAPEPEQPEAAKFDALRETLRAGVQVVTAPQLFPTPIDLAQRMVGLAVIEPGHRVLEPSAGTGRLLGAMGGQMFGHLPERGELVAVEVNQGLADLLRREFPLTDVRCSDFLGCNGDLGTFDRVVMNPPFANGQDIKHIEHARAMLKPGGRLVALCANGPRQAEQLKPQAAAWIELPADTFKEAGTGVRAVLLTMNA